MEALDPYANPLREPSNIAANLGGKISEQQSRILSAQTRHKSQLTLLIVVLGGLLAFFVAVGFLEGSIVGVLIAAVAICAIPLSLMLAVWDIYRQYSKLNEEMGSGVFANSPGVVVWEKPQYVAQVGSHRLKIPEPYKLLPGRYLFYYLPKTGWILSAKRLSTSGEIRENFRQALLDASEDLCAYPGETDYVEGKLAKYSFGGKFARPRWCFQIGDMQFDVPYSLYEATIAQGSYRIHYSLSTEAVVKVEFSLIDSEDDNQSAVRS
jgi:hypothetical protein